MNRREVALFACSAVRPGQSSCRNHGVRQEFHLALLKNVKAVKSCLPISHADVEFKNNMPKDGGDWYYKINGTRVSVKEMGGWNIQHD